MHFFFFQFLPVEKQQDAIFLSIEQEDEHTQTIIGRSHILCDISFANKSETDSNIWFNK